MTEREEAEIKGPYIHSSIRARIEAFFLDNIGKVATREQIMQVATNPQTGITPENWHQRLSELRTDHGYTILSWRNRGDLRVSEYLMPNADRRPGAGRRVRPTGGTWARVLERAGYACQWEDAGERCLLERGERDPVGGGTVQLTPDHVVPHSQRSDIDRTDVDAWQALCGRHQVLKKSFWDPASGWLNVYAIVQSASESEKRRVYEFLREYFASSA